MIEIKASQRLTASAKMLVAETMSSYVKRLKKLGIKQIGVGEGAYVFQHPGEPDTVVKLAKYEDPTYERFIKMCQQNRTNVYLPRVKDVVSEDVFTGGDDPKMYLVFMDKLRAIKESEYEKFGLHVIAVANASLGSEKYGTQGTQYDLETPDLWAAVSKQKNDPALAKVAAFIYGESKVARIDLHMGNIMMRGSQPVIVDPLF